MEHKQASIQQDKKESERIPCGGPRTVVVPRTENGFGFTLRHFIVYPPETSAFDPDCQENEENEEWAEGWRQKRPKISALEPMDTIFVKQVREDGPAHQAGLRKGDRIVSVNGESVTGKTYSQVIALIQSSDSALKLLVVPKDEDILQMAYRSSAYNQGQEPYRGRACEIPDPPALPARGQTNPALDSPNARDKTALAPRFKSEICVTPEDNLPRRISDSSMQDIELTFSPSFDPRYPRQRMSTSSLGSVSSGSTSSYGPPRESVLLRIDERQNSQFYVDESISPIGADCVTVGLVHPRHSTQQLGNVFRRNSSGKDTTSESQYHKPMDGKSASLDSISRSSDSTCSRQSESAVYRPPSADLHEIRRSRENTRLSSQDVGYRCRSQERPKGESYEGVSRSRRIRDNNLRHSSDDLLNQAPEPQPVVHNGTTPYCMTKSLTTGRLPMDKCVASNHPPYTRSHTTSSLGNPSTKPDSHATRWGSDPKTYRSVTYFDPRPPFSSSDLRKGSLPEHSSSHHRPHSDGEFVTYDRAPRDSYPYSPQRTSSHSQIDPNRQTTTTYRDSYGLTVSCRLDSSPRPQRGNQKLADLPHTFGRSAPSLGHSSHAYPGKTPVSLVSERMKKFESADSVDDVPKFRSESGKLPHHFGCDSVASRTALYEQISSETHDEDERTRKISSDSNQSFDEHIVWRNRSYTQPSQSQNTEYSRYMTSRGSLPQARPPLEVEKVQLCTPATLNIYFRADSTPQLGAVVEPSPEMMPSQAGSPYLCQYLQERRSSPDLLDVDRPLRERSPLYQEEDDVLVSPLSRRHKPALRTTSYLQAIHSPKSKNKTGYTYNSPNLRHRNASDQPDSDELDSRQPGVVDIQISLAQEMNLPSASSDSYTYANSSGRSASVSFRDATSEEKEAKLQRRQSYLMATGKDQTTAQEQKSVDKTDSLAPPDSSTAPANSKKSGRLSPELPKLDLSAAAPEILAAVSETSVAESAEDMASNVSQSPPYMDSTATPTKTSIKKLKAFFGERTPRIVEATTDRKYLYDLTLQSNTSEVILEATLLCKVAITDGKRASDRSWKPMWTVLRNNSLYLYKEKTTTVGAVPDEQPVSVKAGIVDIAYDYTKKKNVFRLTTYGGSEYLFQADDHETMLQWIKAIQSQSCVEQTQEQNVLSPEVPVVPRKSAQMEQVPKMSPQVIQKVKKVTKPSLRAKSPASHSPSCKPRKQPSEKEHSDSPKVKESKTWKGKVAKKFKRYGSSSSASAEISETSEGIEVTGTFGIPLELCPPSSFSEYVPEVVELCTRIVEERGLENQGVYRVPGNTGAVNMLQEELNKAPDEISMDNEKWMDVNVVTSLLKSFFRKLPEALIPEDMYQPVINANRIENPEKRMLKIKKLLHDLPEHNFETLRYLADHLSKVTAKWEVNKMDSRNLAIVFGPTLLRTSDDSMVTMVKDMSDQCRIVETIIQHYKWFFSSWDEDIYVPLDEELPDAPPVSRMNEELLSKAENMELGERGREISAKDMISSVISAANRKIRKRDKTKSGDPLELEGFNETTYNERNIDREIELRKDKQVSNAALVKEDSLTKIEISSSSCVTTERETKCTTSEVVREKTPENAKVPSDQSDVRERDLTKPNESDSVDSDQARKMQVMRYPAYHHQIDLKSYSTENTKPVVSYLRGEPPLQHKESIKPIVSQRPGDDVSTKHDEVNHHPLGSHTLAYQAQQRLRQLEAESQAILRHKETEGKLEQEKHALAKQRIELELERTRAELEKEDSCDEDLLAKPAEMTSRIAEYSSKYSDYINNKSDVASVTSDYSTMSSTNMTLDKSFSQQSQPGGYTSDYSSTLSSTKSVLSQRPSFSEEVHKFRRNIAKLEDVGKSQSWVEPRPYLGAHDHSKAGSHSARDDIELYRRPLAFDMTKMAGRAPLTRRKEQSAVDKLLDRRDSLEHFGFLPRKGSLDSLLGHHDRLECELDECGDLLESITNTFDEKLRLLQEPSKSLSSIVPSSKESHPNEKSHPKVSHLSTEPGQQHEYAKNVSDNLFDRSFRNPSLHKLLTHQKSDPLIGIASRFDRRGSDSQIKAASSASSLSSQGVKSSRATASDHQYRALMSSKSVQSRKEPVSRTNISKSAKTDANLSKQQLEKSKSSDNTAAIGASNERLFGSQELPTTVSASAVDDPPQEAKNKVSSSPKKKSLITRRNRVKRRHTLGGTQDFEHFKALMVLSQSPVTRTDKSAWDRLQPAVHELADHNKDLKSWLAHQRLRRVGSSPDIVNPSLYVFRDSFNFPGSFYDSKKVRANDVRESPSRDRLSSPTTGSSQSATQSPESLASTSQKSSHTFNFESSI